MRGDVRDQRHCWSASSASMKSTPSSTWRPRPSSRSPIAIRCRRSKPTSPAPGILLEACRRSPTVKQIVVASSDKAYGDQEMLPYDEETPLQGQHPYDVSKSCGGPDRADAMPSAYDLPVVITRCGNFYGGGDLNWNRIVPGTIRSVLRGQRPVIRSDGKFVRDYFYVEDGAAAYMLLAEQLAAHPELRGEASTSPYGNQVTVLELVRPHPRADGIASCSPRSATKPVNEIRKQYLNADKARKMLGWSPLFTLRGGAGQDHRLVQGVPRRGVRTHEAGRELATRRHLAAGGEYYQERFAGRDVRSRQPTWCTMPGGSSTPMNWSIWSIPAWTSS